MKPSNKSRQELVEDLLPSKEVTGRLGIEDVLGLVEREQLKRRNRIRGAGIALVALAVVFVSVGSLQTRRDTGMAVSPGTSMIPKSQMPKIKQVDDEGLLRMVDELPAAFAKWPDGRESLFVLVTHDNRFELAENEPELHEVRTDLPDH
jgi:hypothetical protein